MILLALIAVARLRRFLEAAFVDAIEDELTTWQPQPEPAVEAA